MYSIFISQQNITTIQLQKKKKFESLPSIKENFLLVLNPFDGQDPHAGWRAWEKESNRLINKRLALSNSTSLGKVLSKLE